MTKIVGGSDLISPMVSRYVRVGLKSSQVQTPGEAQAFAQASADQVSWSPGLRQLEAGNAVLQKTFAHAQTKGLLGPPSPKLAADIDTSSPPALEAALLPTSEKASGALAEDVTAKIVGPAFDRFQHDHPTPSADELASFRDDMLAAVRTGFSEAREQLEGFGNLDATLEEHLDRAQGQAIERFDAFFANLTATERP